MMGIEGHRGSKELGNICPLLPESTTPHSSSTGMIDSDMIPLRGDTDKPISSNPGCDKPIKRGLSRYLILIDWISGRGHPAGKLQCNCVPRPCSFCYVKEIRARY